MALILATSKPVQYIKFCIDGSSIWSSVLSLGFETEDISTLRISFISVIQIPVTFNPEESIFT